MDRLLNQRMAKTSLRHHLILGLTLGVGIGLSIMAALFVEKWEASNQQTRFQRQIENLATTLQRNLNRYTDVLEFLKDHYTVAQGQITRQEFAEFAARSLNAYSGIQALEWAPLIRQRDRLAYEQRIQAEGYPAFQITELSDQGQLLRAGDRPYYIPVTYIAPFTENEAALGFDLTSSQPRLAALQVAREQGKITATGRIQLVQEQRDQFGFLVFLPLYQTADIPSTPAARREQFEGFLLGVFRVSDVIEEALQGLRYDLDFSLYDRADSAPEFLGRYDAITQDVTAIAGDRIANPAFTRDTLRHRSFLCPATADCTRTLTVGQRQWLVEFSPSANYPDDANYGTIATLLVGLLLTGSLVIFLHHLDNELERTKAVSDLKLRFFSMASHELRTPLSTILLSSESLQVNHDQLSEAQKQINIQRISLTAKRMSQQIADLLTLTRAEVGKLEFHPELLDVESFCQQAIEEVQTSQRQPIAFTSDCQNTKAFWDKKLARSLLINLLENAVKYSANQAVQFTLSSDDRTATIQVRDRGIGIPSADLRHIQDAFYRGSNVGALAGTGLGLALVKTCVELHQGEWTIDSVEAEGTIVTVKLPLE